MKYTACMPRLGTPDSAVTANDVEEWYEHHTNDCLNKLCNSVWSVKAHTSHTRRYQVKQALLIHSRELNPQISDSLGT